MNYAEVIEFVRKQIADNTGPTSYPFRDRFEHTMRVYRWAIRLQSQLGGDMEIIALAALLHSIRWEEGKDLGEVSAEVAANYLDGIGVEPEKISRIGEIIRIHSKRDVEMDLSVECKIVMDADLLDEIGAVSVLWNSMGTALDDDADYRKVYNRVKSFYKESRPKIRLCKTEAGRMEYNRRMRLLEDFLTQLEKEIF